MSIIPEHRQRLAMIKARADELGIEGVFTENGKSLAEMAFLLWEQEYLSVPTSECLLMALEQKLTASDEVAHSGAPGNTHPGNFNDCKANDHT